MNTKQIKTRVDAFDNLSDAILYSDLDPKAFEDMYLMELWHDAKHVLKEIDRILEEGT